MALPPGAISSAVTGIQISMARRMCKDGFARDFETGPPDRHRVVASWDAHSAYRFED
jgi:hypothetical protein